MSEEKAVFRKHRPGRIVNYLFLLPFVMGFRPLIIRYDPLDLLLYSLGILVILGLILLSNRVPYVTLAGDRLILRLHYYQEPEVHFLDRIILVEPLKKGILKVYSRDYKPVRLHLDPAERARLLILLQERNLKIKE